MRVFNYLSRECTIYRNYSHDSILLRIIMYRVLYSVRALRDTGYAYGPYARVTLTVRRSGVQQRKVN